MGRARPRPMPPTGSGRVHADHGAPWTDVRPCRSESKEGRVHPVTEAGTPAGPTRLDSSRTCKPCSRHDARSPAYARLIHPGEKGASREHEVRSISYLRTVCTCGPCTHFGFGLELA